MAPSRFVAYSAVVIAYLSTGAFAQVDIPDGCVEGSGTYSGDFSGVAQYLALTSETRKVMFFRGDLIESYDPGIIGSEFLFSEFSSDGKFSIQQTEERTRNILTINGTYANCGVTGTWMVSYGDGSPSKSGSFEIEGNSPPSMMIGTDLCGATGTGLFATILLMMTSMARRRRRSDG